MVPGTIKLLALTPPELVFFDISLVDLLQLGGMVSSGVHRISCMKGHRCCKYEATCAAELSARGGAAMGLLVVPVAGSLHLLSKGGLAVSSLSVSGGSTRTFIGSTL